MTRSLVTTVRNAQFSAKGSAVYLACIALTTACGAKVLSVTTPDGGATAEGAICTSDMMPVSAVIRSATEDCPADDQWLPSTPAVALVTPAPHPSSNCPFYQDAWQNFLIATALDRATRETALVAYPTIDDVFQSARPHALRNTAERAWLGDVKQPAFGGILIDQNGRTLYYGIHVNQAFADFAAAHGLTTLSGIQNADPMLTFPPGVVELKTAWQEIDGPAGAADYITTSAWVSTLAQDPVTRVITEDKNHPRFAQLALLSVEVGFTLPGHPEFIWALFEHGNGCGRGDLVPTLPDNPNEYDNTNVLGVVSNRDFPLYRHGTPANQANQVFFETRLSLDPATQSFPGKQTSIYRMFPASLSNSTSPDSAVTRLNVNVAALFERHRDGLDPEDMRMQYRLVGGAWMDKPSLFALNSELQNNIVSPLLSNGSSDPYSRGNIRPDVSQADERAAVLSSGKTGADDLLSNGPDSPFSIIGGQDRLSGAAMESFTQTRAAYANCGMCHNTEGVNGNGAPYGDPSLAKILDAKLINVSRVFARFVLDESY
jgi:hypothetical protein